jgi:hypothetical protein
MNSFWIRHQTWQSKAILASLIAYLVAIYGPLVSQAGISVDDWGDIAHNLDCSSFWQCYGTWFPLFSNRPLAPLPITVLTFLLGTSYSGYLIVNCLIYLVAIGLCSKVMNALIGQKSAITFLVFAAIPIIAMPVITSPINQSTATLSFLLWSVSLTLLMRSIQAERVMYWIASYLCLLLAFLTYEVILPLLILTALLPWIWDEEKFALFRPRYWIRYLLPIALVLVLITLWQKGIAPQFMEVDSRLKFIPTHAFAKLHTFLHVFYRQIPALFLKMPPYLQWTSLLGACFGLASLIISCYTPYSSADSPLRSNQNIQHRLLWAALLCFLSSSSIFILSDESAVSAGYQARGLSSTWFAFAILLAAINPGGKGLLTLWNSLLSILFVLCALCFSVQRDQTITAWQMQLAIIDNANQLIGQKNLEAKATILGDVPHYLPNNYNDEIVFSQPWDFGAALAITNSNQILPGPVIDSSRGELRNLQIKNNIVTAQNFAGANLENFWVYHFDTAANKGSLLRISNSLQFDEFIKSINK